MPPGPDQDEQHSRPASVDRAVLLLWGLVIVGAAVTVLVIVFRHELADAWSAGHPPDSAIKQPEFVPVVIVSYVVVAGLILTLVPFLRGGHNWARYSLAATVVFIIFSTVAGLRTDPPPVFVACAVRLAGLQRGAPVPPLPSRHHVLRARPVRCRDA